MATARQFFQYWALALGTVSVAVVLLDVSWSDGSTRGDMGIDFTIQNHAIAVESWGDWGDSARRAGGDPGCRSGGTLKV